MLVHLMSRHHGMLELLVFRHTGHCLGVLQKFVGSPKNWETLETPPESFDLEDLAQMLNCEAEPNPISTNISFKYPFHGHSNKPYR